MSKKNNSGSKIPYMPICMCLGIAIGCGIGAGADNIPLWMCVGLSVGMGLGVSLDARKRQEAEEKESQQDQAEE